MKKTTFVGMGLIGVVGVGLLLAVFLGPPSPKMVEKTLPLKKFLGEHQG